MKNETYLFLVLSVIKALTVLTHIDQSDASPAPEPKRRKVRLGNINNCTSWSGNCNTRTRNNGSSWVGYYKKKNHGNWALVVVLDV